MNKTTVFWLPKLQCTILPGKYLPGDPEKVLYQHAYSHWKEVWTKVLEKVNGLAHMNADNFLRQDMHIILHVDNKIMGMFSSHFFDATQPVTSDHHYFKAYDPQVMRSLYERGGVLMSGEYLSSDPAARKIFDDFSIADILIGVLLEAFKVSGASATFGTTIKAAGTHECGFRLGYTHVGDYSKYGLDCMLFLNTQETVQSHPNPEARKLIEKLWTNARVHAPALLHLFEANKQSTSQRRIA